MLYEKYRHSASGGNMFIECPSAFVWRYGLQNWGEDNERQAMGTAAEWGAWQGLLNDLSDADVRKATLEKFDELRSGEVGERRDAAPAIACQFMKALRPLGKPLAYQPWKGVWLEELGKQISIKPDLRYEGFLVDLKATLKLPSAASPSHLRQQGLYCGEYQMPTRILYGTPKKFGWYELNRCEAVKGAMELLTAFEMIERWATVCPTPQRAMRYLPLNPDSFYWSNPKDVDRATAMWSAA